MSKKLITTGKKSGKHRSQEVAVIKKRMRKSARKRAKKSILDKIFS